MKQILITAILLLATCNIAFSQKATVTVTDSAKGKKSVTVINQKGVSTTYVPSYTDTDEDGITVESTVISDSIVDNAMDYSMGIDTFNFDNDFFKNIGSTAAAGVTLAFFAIAVVFAFPLLVIFLVFYFRYRNKRERYRLVEKALEAGQPIPDEFLKENLKANVEADTKGIKNMCVGVGLFIFLWALTGSFGLGCIGILVFCSGLSSYLIARKNNRTNNEK